MPEDSELADQIRRRVQESILARFQPGAEERRPDGIVTIAFTDVVESSRLVQQLGDRDARALLRKHDDVLREVIRAHEGIEVERAGDGFMLVFPTASSGVAGTIALQRALAEEPEIREAGLRVRAGMQTGEVITEERGYFGRTVFQAARISELAGGGQILVSDATMLVAGPDRFAFTDAGEHELRGLGTTHRLFEVGWAETQ